VPTRRPDLAAGHPALQHLSRQALSEPRTVVLILLC